MRRSREPERSIPAVVLGGTGYVAGELLRLIAAHPNFTLAGIMSDSRPGEPVAAAFGHLASAFADDSFKSQGQIEAIIEREESAAIFSAAPHGAAATLIDTLLIKSEAAGRTPHVVDISADFRFRTAAAYEAVYKHGHGAPSRLHAFTCAVPEHLRELMTPHVAHRDAAGLRAAAGDGPDHARAVRVRGHRQHRLGPQTKRWHPPSDAPQ
jgi:N-acetyl-gamma-glutamylphosphate reductase